MVVSRSVWETTLLLMCIFTVLLILPAASPALAGYSDGAASGDFTFLGTPTKWNPGLNTAQFGGFPAPGGASWSAMPAGVLISGAAPASEFVDHPAAFPGPVSTDIITLIAGPEPTGTEYVQFNMALNIWAAASAFTNLGQVVDGATAHPGMAAAGDIDAFFGHLGDIRAAGYVFDGAGGTLAHGFQPGTSAMFGGAIGGDIHFDIAETWVDDPADAKADPDFDFFTVALHEIGHALGLGHSDVVGAVMEPIYQGARRALHADDIAGIRAIYGVVPEPCTLLLATFGLIGLVGGRRRI